MNLATAKVFMNGRSQAIRLPKAFRVEGNEVYIKKENNKLIIEPKPQVSWAEVFKTFKGETDFDVNSAGIDDKPRRVDF
jgi:antitoxin VapB